MMMAVFAAWMGSRTYVSCVFQVFGCLSGSDDDGCLRGAAAPASCGHGAV